VTTVEALRRILLRDLAALRREVEAYEREADLWVRPPGVPNSAGSLALHLAGNLRHFIGSQLGGTGYLRDRDAEFASRNVPRSTLLRHVDDAMAEVDRALRDLAETRLAEPYPLEVGGVRLSTGMLLTHLATHFAYHLGQMDYHRRVVTGRTGGVGAQAVAELAGP
jgi:uncharacterized damage-inducible protein DinB